MAATFGGAIKASAPCIVDTNASQGTGAACTGIGLNDASADAGAGIEASIGAARIGGAPGTDVKIEAGDGIGV